MSEIFNPGPIITEYVRGATAAGSWQLPAGSVLLNIAVRSNNANAMTGGLKIGTTVGGTQILLALALPGLALNASVPGLPGINATPLTLYFDAVVAWNNANVDIAFIYAKVF